MSRCMAFWQITEACCETFYRWSKLFRRLRTTFKNCRQNKLVLIFLTTFTCSIMIYLIKWWQKYFKFCIFSFFLSSVLWHGRCSLSFWPEQLIAKTTNIRRSSNTGIAQYFENNTIPIFSYTRIHFLSKIESSSWW